MFETTALVVSAVEQALFTRRRAEIRFSSTLIGRHSSIGYHRPSSHPPRAAIRAGTLRRRLPVLISVGISFALGLAIDASNHKVRLAPTRFHSPLANLFRRPSSMGAPPMSEARDLARIVV
jgi:hypothetical protein